MFKTTAAAFGIPGYTLKGLEKQVEKRYSRGLKANLIVVRIKQGILAFERATEEVCCRPFSFFGPPFVGFTMLIIFEGA